MAIDAQADAGGVERQRQHCLVNDSLSDIDGVVDNLADLIFVLFGFVAGDEIVGSCENGGDVDVELLLKGAQAADALPLQRSGNRRVYENSAAEGRDDAIDGDVSAWFDTNHFGADTHLRWAGLADWFGDSLAQNVGDVKDKRVCCAHDD